jgi:integrase
MASRRGVPEWTLHDLRRTFATNLAGLDVPPHVVERLLNHASGTISGVAAIYNRFSYADEMRDAMKRWEERLTALLAAHALAA